MLFRRLPLILIIVCLPGIRLSYAQDTLNVMAYNVLHYGDLCQGSNSFLHRNLKIILQHENPDVLGFVKAQVIKKSSTDFAGISAVGFADSILVNSFNAVYPNKYDHAPIVNFSNDPDADMDLLFFNKNKLGFVSVENLCSIQEDFNLYKLYYKDPYLSKTSDTTFLYVILNHTVSGSDSRARDTQDSVIVKNLKKRFYALPNLISMGDFNTHSSYEPGYQLMTASIDSNFLFFDPPYFPDKTLTYPSSWQSNPEMFSKFLNTSTRQGAAPNACGSAGGAKGWYLHIFLSPWVTQGANYIRYVASSYRTIGNDGHRVGLSINDSVAVARNASVSSAELNALYQFSDKYPISVKLAVSFNETGISLLDPVINPIMTASLSITTISVTNPVQDKIVLFFPDEMIGTRAVVSWRNSTGQDIGKEYVSIFTNQVTLPVDFLPGLYILTLEAATGSFYFRIIKN